MAKKKWYKTHRRFRNDAWIPVNFTLALSTLVDNIVISNPLLPAFTRRFRVISTKLNVTMIGTTLTEGPISVGFAHSDYSNAEIAESNDIALLSTSSKIEQERSRRLVRKIGQFAGNEVNQELRGNRGGEFIRTRLNWAIEEDFALSMWAQNKSGATLTSGQSLEIDGVIYGRWE